MEENKINALMDMTVSKIRQLVDADTIIGKPISTPDGITVIPVSRMSFGIGTVAAIIVLIVFLFLLLRPDPNKKRAADAVPVGAGV